MATAQKDLHHHGSNNLGDQTKEMASETASRAKNIAEGAVDKVKDMASDAAGKARDMGAAAAHKAGEAANFMGKKADEATSAVGSGMKSLAGTIRDKTGNAGVVGTAGSAVAHTLEAGGRYLEEQGLSGIGDDLTNMIRRNPIPAVLLGVGVGFLVARALTPRS